MSVTQQNDQTQEPLPAKAPLVPARRGKPTGARKWLYRLAAMTLIPALLLGLLEGSLRVAGFGYPTNFFLDGSRIEGSDCWIDNQEFDRWVFPPGLKGTAKPICFTLPKRKAPGTYRIFVLGESAAQGYPDYTTSFARVLEVLLRHHYPDRRFEVINTGMVAINSHVILPIARECAQHEPDLIVVHVGNNEVVGPFGAAGKLGPFSPHLNIIRANLALRRTRTGQLLGRLMQRPGRAKQDSQAWNGMALFANSHIRADDPRLERITGHFRGNLRAICRAGTDAGAAVLVCTIPVNLKDSPPFGSLHADGLTEQQKAAWEKVYEEGIRRESEKKYAAAIRCYQSAARIDDQFADLAYRLARCHEALGQTSEAKMQYVRARDLDTLRFRTDSTLNQTIRDVVAECDGVRLADAETAFAQASPHGIPGEGLFLEHVHMSFKGNYLLARTLFERIRELATASLGTGRGDKVPPLSEEECAERLAYTEWHAKNNASEVLSMISLSAPFVYQLDHRERSRRWQKKVDEMQRHLESGGIGKAVAITQKAVEAAKEDWMIPMLFGQMLSEGGHVLQATKQYAAAATMMRQAEEQYTAAAALMRHNFATRLQLAGFYLNARKFDEAIGQYQEVLRLAPNCMEADFGLADALAGQGKLAAARAVYEERLRKGPNRLRALFSFSVFLYKARELEEAEQRLQEVLRMAPNYAQALPFLGDVELEQGKVDEAIKHYEAGLKLWPDWQLVREKLDKARKVPGRSR